MNHQLFINGQWEIGDNKQMNIIDPSNESVIAKINEASEAQTKLAIKAARKAFEETDWKTNKEKRIEVLQKVAKLLEENLEKMAKIESINTGKPIRETRMDISDSITCFRYYAELIHSQEVWSKEMDDGSVSTVFLEPIGVCSLIIPWNFPLLLGSWKLAPALAAGNTVVYKPSELTPLSVIHFTELLQETNIPDGVFNLVLGDGDVVGNRLTTDEYVDMVSFTGSVAVGRKINEICASSFKRVSLELGGKSALIVSNDVDIDKAVEWILFGGFLNQGEVCVASSRIIIHEAVYDTIVKKLREKLFSIKIGAPLNETTEMGPIISKDHLQKIQDYITIGIDEGATLTGGQKIDREGYFMEPALFTNVSQNMRIVQEEIFGPVITIQSFSDWKEAVELANDTKFGLAAGILSEDIKFAETIASKIQAGTVWINNYHIPQIEAPWGGYKQSGIGRELGPQGLEAFMEFKHVSKHHTLNELNWYKLD